MLETGTKNFKEIFRNSEVTSTSWGLLSHCFNIQNSNFWSSWWMNRISVSRISQKKNSIGAALVHTVIGSNVKRLWVAVSVKKILFKMSKFPNHYILKLFQKFRENFFQNFPSQHWLLYTIIFLAFTWNFWLHSCS